MWISAPSSTATPIATRYHHNGTDNRSSNRERPDVDRGAGTGLSLTGPRVASLVVSGSVDARPRETAARSRESPLPAPPRRSPAGRRGAPDGRRAPDPA